MSTGIGSSSASAEKSGYASETIPKVSNHYESSTIVKQDLVVASQAEKIPLDYECPKQSIEKLQPTVQTFKDTDSSNCKSTPDDGNGIPSEATTPVLETSFSAEVNQRQAHAVNTKQEASVDAPSINDTTGSA